MLQPTSVVQASTNQVSSSIGGEAVILSLKDGVYYGLDPVGARIWSLIQEPRAVATLRDTLLQEYEVAGEQCERDLLTLLDELASAGLVEISAANHSHVFLKAGSDL